VFSASFAAFFAFAWPLLVVYEASCLATANRDAAAFARKVGGRTREQKREGPRTFPPVTAPYTLPNWNAN
jgi:hypothetical protein